MRHCDDAFFFHAAKLLHTNITVKKLTKINWVKWWRTKQWTMIYVSRTSRKKGKERNTSLQVITFFSKEYQSICLFVTSFLWPKYFRVFQSIAFFKRTTKIFVGQYRWRCTKRRICYLSFFNVYIRDRVFFKFKEKNIVSRNATTVRRNKQEKNRFMDNFYVNVCTNRFESMLGYTAVEVRLKGWFINEKEA